MKSTNNCAKNVENMVENSQNNNWNNNSVIKLQQHANQQQCSQINNFCIVECCGKVLKILLKKDEKFIASFFALQTHFSINYAAEARRQTL